MVFGESEENKPRQMSHDQQQTGFARRAPHDAKDPPMCGQDYREIPALNQDAAARRAGEMK